MKRLVMIALLPALAACPRDKQESRATKTSEIPTDTTTTDLSKITTALPEAAPDTFTLRKLDTSTSAGAVGLPEAPEVLLTAVAREQAVSRFCFVEFGKKSDPTLQGNVAMVVTVSD